MTDREKRKAVELEAAFIKDATVQAESMDIRFTDPIALVCSEPSSENDEDTAESGKKGAGGVPKAHSGQRNKKVRGKDEVIREETNLNDANRTVRENHQQMENVLKNAASAKSPDDRAQSISTVQAFLQRLKKSASFYNKFDPGFILADPEGATYSLPLELDMWRTIVGASGMGESEMVYSLDGRTGAATRMTATGAKQTLFVFQIIQGLVEQCVGGPASGGAKGKAAKETVNATWDKLDRLRTSSNGNLTTPYEVAAFLHFVALKYIQYHFECRLMCSIVRLRLDNWKEERERARINKEQPNIQVGIPLFLYVHHTALAMVRNFGVSLSVDEVNLLRSALAFFDFPAAYDEKVDRAIAQWQGKPLPVLPATMRPREAIYRESPETMQLMHMGHLLERPIIPQKDYRVVFNPDQWQRDLLDIVDQRGSAVVCAPTSAGKTFISYYCMLSALRTSNTKVVVYIAPNRALINQAVADVCGRYGTKQYTGGGTNVYGVHGGDDYHRFHDKCQVLVTLPEVLETLLLAPKYKEWTKRLDYVILDEIHTMESSGNGDVWERVLALLPCPFVALSATLGETQQLCGWLNRVQGRLEQQEQALAAAKQGKKSSRKKRDYTVHDIPRSGAIQRWNDIQKHIYLPPPGYAPTLKKLTATYTERHIQDLHPLSILTLDQLRNGFPPDISLVPSEVVQLHERMVQHFNEKVLQIPKGAGAQPQGPWATLQIVHDMSAQLASLMPERYFAETNYITQSQARQYEADVKNAFVYWTILSQSAVQHHHAGSEDDVLSPEEAGEFSAVMLDLCESILRTFSQHLYADEVKLEKYAITIATERGEQLQDVKAAAPGAASKKAPAYFPDSKEFIGSNIISVLRELNTRKMGPVIVFSFESEDCDDLVKTVVEQLELAEAAYRQTEEFAAYKANMERKAAVKEATRRQHESNLKQKRLAVDDRGEVSRADREADNMDNDDEDCEVPDVLPEFTFIGSAVSCHEEVREAIDVCEKRGEPLLARAIKRGIGIHHAGVKGKIRRLNEILFRGRHCGVIFATETLALGVHSPCRSVVLAGDHVLLNTTQFRQMMGRAGRRGLDSIGHLVFLSISMKKITRLMTSSMTVIKGNVQLTPVTQLRLLQLYDYVRHRSTAERPSKHAEEWKEYAFQLAERLFVNPLYFHGRETVAGGNMEPFSVELLQMLLGFLQRQGLHYSDRPSSLGTLLVNAMYVFRNAGVGVEGFAFLSMLVRGVFEQADFTGPAAQQLNTTVYPQEPSQESCSEALAEVVAYLFTIHRICGLPLEIHRSALSDPVVTALWGKKAAARQHRVVLAPLHSCLRQVPGGKAAATVLDNAAAFRVVSAFYANLAQQLRAEEAAGDVAAPAPGRLPFMKGAKSFVFAKHNKAVEMPLTAKLQATTVPFAAREPFVAISGCGDNFAGVEDLSWTLRSGLLCDRQMLPVLDFTDGCRHDGAQVLINACVADFMRCQAQVDSIRSNYRFTLLEDLNGLTQSESYAVLSRVEHLLSNLAGLFRQDPLPPMEVLSSLFPEEGEGEAPKYYAGARRVLDLATRLHGLRSQIDKDYSGDQFRIKMEGWKKEKK
ncbi:ATP-dependent DEAD/H RNA helicase [Strigomonas culicis]|uniref:ATP-dependent DEAD/H RNA helicase n=1 Tax=Strigomonas culicis TaxID=28005 RepID=S9TV16_9TRYP|nr:ATP-dependent DEAD/H RNA helicase [Strigomonas culicis]|eukprot:EPY20408.1 ATP-dependent DEAD/H RNA helicase [Strigomonas culicis]